MKRLEQKRASNKVLGLVCALIMSVFVAFVARVFAGSLNAVFLPEFTDLGVIIAWLVVMIVIVGPRLWLMIAVWNLKRA